jgi:hypothetical protein
LLIAAAEQMSQPFAGHWGTWLTGMQSVSALQD